VFSQRRKSVKNILVMAEQRRARTFQKTGSKLTSEG
jgi:hypothetical protein